MTYKVLDAYVLHHAAGNGSPNGKFYQAWVVSDGVEFYAMANWGANTEAAPRAFPNGQLLLMANCATREQALSLVRAKTQAKKNRGYFDYTQFGEAAGIELAYPHHKKWLDLLPTPVPTPDADGKTSFERKVDELAEGVREAFLRVNEAIDNRSPHVHSFRVMYGQEVRALEELTKQAKQYREIVDIKTAAMMAAAPAKPAGRKKVDRLDAVAANLQALT